MNKNLTLGVTGGIASGKSFVIKIFRKLGAEIVDADEISKKLLQRNTRESKLVVRYFGNEIKEPGGIINRKKLGDIVFSDKEKLKILERILHPVIINKIKYKLKKKSKTKITVLDAPLLFEKKLEGLVDLTLLVYLPEKIQLTRLMRRDGIKKKEALRKISYQMSQNEKIKKADIIINNSLNKILIRKKIIKIWNFLKRIDKN